MTSLLTLSIAFFAMTLGIVLALAVYLRRWTGGSSVTTRDNNGSGTAPQPAAKEE